MKFRVIDIAADGQEHEVIARSPEEAVQKVIPDALVRGSVRGNTLRAKVYWTSAEGGLTLVKFYQADSPTTKDPALS